METSCGNEYLDIFFDLDRSGFIDVTEKILSYLDFKSFVQFKRSCKLIYNFISDQNRLEDRSLRRKLSSDWKKGPAKTYAILTMNRLISHARLFNDGARVACAVDHEVVIFDIPTGKCQLTLKGPHQAPISCVELIYDQNDQVVMYATGCREGVLALWSTDGQCLVRKQLFGRIMFIKSRGRFLATAHFGKPFDAGCIMLRELKSIEDTPVVFALFEDIFPVITVDFTDKFVAALEWSGTFNGVDGGYVSIYKLYDKTPVVNLSDITECSFSTCRFLGESQILTGGHDKLIRLWHFNDEPEFSVECVRVFSHHINIIAKLEVTLDRAVTRDIGGKIIVWDLSLMNKNVPADDVIVREEMTNTKMVATVAINDRQLCFGSFGVLTIRDFWSTSNDEKSKTESTL